jgi:hypothetical protein
MPPTDPNEATTNFIQTARIACREIEGFDGKRFAPLMKALTRLLAASESLKACELEPDVSEFHIEAVELHAPASSSQDTVFYEIFDPSDERSVTRVSFEDCLRDIYGALEGGLRVLDHSVEKRPTVLWEWRFGYQFHWGRHLIDAVRFIMLSGIVEGRTDPSRQT